TAPAERSTVECRRARVHPRPDRPGRGRPAFERRCGVGRSRCLPRAAALAGVALMLFGVSVVVGQQRPLGLTKAQVERTLDMTKTDRVERPVAAVVKRA